MGDLTEQQEQLLEQGIIDLFGKVDDGMFEYVRECMLRLQLKNNPPISVRITSGGGKAGFGLFIYDLLCNYPGKKTGVVVGIAESMAAIILQACNIRISYKHSVILIHDVSISAEIGRVTLPQLRNKKRREKLESYIESDQETIYGILQKKMNKSKKFIMDLCDEERELSASEALRLGLIDKIV